MIDIKALLSDMILRKASDLHLKVGSVPVFRIDSKLQPTDYDPLAPEDVEKIASEIMSTYHRERFQSHNEVDFAYEAEGLGRFRTNIFRQRGFVGIVMRMVKMDIPSFEELGLPPILKKIAMSERGIILATGTTSCGKSTTISAMVDYINQNKRVHIITVEDPIEYLHRDKKSIINQREVGIDTESFHGALKRVMRQDPDLIVIGEMRDSESFMAALASADTGHVVFSTLHTTDTAQAVGRILEFFPLEERDQVRQQLSATLRAVICQRLVPRASGEGVTPAVEILINNLTVQKLIHENKMLKLHAAVETAREDGMQTFNQSLLDLYNSKLITKEEAFAHATNPDALKMNMQGIFLDEAKRILAT
ncbi:PilT/PilU family type 4a pilus ATPase [bacterium]|nr:PilT/PilU family type 4a pilus ATPase [bacterium]